MAFLNGPRLLDWANSPPHLQFNKYVLTGYRPISSVQDCIRSLFYLHNELGNIYTHGIPLLCFLVLLPLNIPWSQISVTWLGVVHFLACLSPQLGSVVYHLFMNHEGGEPVYHTLLTLDMCGICMINTLATLTVNQWTLMEKTIEVLAPFEELTRVVSAETATAAVVIPAITVLKCVLSREHSTDQGIKTMKSTLLEAVERRFSQVETEPLYSIATLVDPRYKDRYFKYPDNLRQAKDALIQEVGKMEVRRAASEESEAEPVNKVPRQNTASSSLGSVFDEILEESETETGSVSTSSADVQMQSYLAQQTIPRSDNPLQYWRAHATPFPSLVAIAAKFLCAPCTGVDSERLFSAVSNVIDEKRNRLSADTVEMLTFLKKNLHFILK
ncbi:hypothetical protein SKAU_G00287850 [Synaphobranchus kaupii]|uniref:HAT C-terminal dimerisation domain-containing protein n=1 Tax=Synaphobranchus kaupii TaxID=118154 RepID=A0A9Q1EYK6_SYNKA|nr:hypothetical protein SKAU_G00287850 [Synaphobranchus kaupii]